MGGAYLKANQCFVNLSRHERQIERSHQAAYRELRCLQYARAMDRNPFYVRSPHVPETRCLALATITFLLVTVLTSIQPGLGRGLQVEHKLRQRDSPSSSGLPRLLPASLIV